MSTFVDCSSSLVVFVCADFCCFCSVIYITFRVTWSVGEEVSGRMGGGGGGGESPSRT